MPISVKRRVNVTIDDALLGAARDAGLNVSAVAEAALREAVREVRAKDWNAVNAAAIDQRAAWIEANGLPLAAWQAWLPK